MLTVIIPEQESYDELNNEFIYSKEVKLQLEHSLVSIAKWESKWNIPFLKSGKDRTDEQVIDYVRCMTITQNVNPDVYCRLTNDLVDKIVSYIEEPMTATWFSESSGGKNKEIITNELIYYWMIAMGIPFECQRWHLNRLLTLIDVCNLKNNPPKKKSMADIASRNRELNERRKAELKTKG